ncbi:hypothetical protein [Rufibacter immobilis]|nr:hypothetical protein [Rufibacter immobilis]
MLKKVSHVIQHHLKYPLMWVMLLWALTLPGQEVEVYRFLFGDTSSATPRLHLGAADHQGKGASIKAEGLHVFQDAKASSYLVLSLPQNLSVSADYILPAFSPAYDEPSVSYAVVPVALLRLAQLLPSCLQPNAP